MAGIKSGRTRPGLATLTGLIAVHAIAGAVGLIVGVLTPGDEAVARLPWHSTVLAGVTLAIVVGAPMAVAAVLLARRDAQGERVAAVAGAALIGWIALELAVLREFSWLQPVFLAAGILVLVGALR